MQPNAFDRLGHGLHGPSDLISFVDSRGVDTEEFSFALTRALAAGIPWPRILMALMPFVFQLMVPGANLPAIVAAMVQAVLALLGGGALKT